MAEHKIAKEVGILHSDTVRVAKREPDKVIDELINNHEIQRYCEEHGTDIATEMTRITRELTSQ